MSELQVIEQQTAIAVFTSEAMDETLRKIETEVLSFVPDTSNVSGRKEIASLAYKVSQSKTILDSAGKTLVSDWKSKAKLVDASRKKARDFLDNLRDKARQPLTDWESAELKKVAAEKLKLEIEVAHIDALAMNDLFNREKAIAEKERIAAEKEMEDRRITEERRLFDEREKREQLMKEKAALEAKQAAEREAQRKIDEAQRLEAEAVAKAEQIKIDAVNAENRAKWEAEQAEKNRLQATEDARIAQEKAVHDAEERAKWEAEENARIAKEAVIREEKRKENIKIEENRASDLLAKNKAHQGKINRDAVKCFTDNGFDTETAKKIITLIAKGKIKHTTINY